MTTKSNIAAALPSATQTVLAVLGTIVLLYGAFYKTIAGLIPAPEAATLGGIVLFITAVVQRGPQIQELASDIATGQPLAEILGDLKAAIAGIPIAVDANTAATQENTAQTAAMASIATAKIVPDPMPPETAPAPALAPVENVGGA